MEPAWDFLKELEAIKLAQIDHWMQNGQNLHAKF